MAGKSPSKSGPPSGSRLGSGESADSGLALDKLSAAFAQMLNTGSDPYAQPAGSEALVVDEGPMQESPGERSGPSDDGLQAREDACPVTPRSILEAMLFVGSPRNDPLTSKQVASLMRGVRPAEVDALVRELNAQYLARGCPYHIATHGAGYRLVLCDEYARMRDKFYGKIRQARLSQAAIEVLAIVGYHEPLSADEISKLRGTPSGHILFQLVRRGLLRLERNGGQSRRGQYFTTPKFLQLFGMASLDDLPRSQELEPR